jgi:hypothetical protein
LWKLKIDFFAREKVAHSLCPSVIFQKENNRPKGDTSPYLVILFDPETRVA